MSGGEALLDAAMRHLGAPFRLHGRDPATGLDCVGLIAASLITVGRTIAIPNGYAMRGAGLAAIDRAARDAGLSSTGRPMVAGDILLTRPGPAQFHLAIAAHGVAAIHAHAGLRRVVMGPLPPEWPIIRHWRLTEQQG